MHDGRSPRVLLLFTTTGYQGEDFLKAARALGIETVIGTDACHRLEDPWGSGAVPLRFEEPERSTDRIAELASESPIDAILPLGDRPLLLAALAGERLGLPHNPPGAVRTARNKWLARRAFRSSGLSSPWFLVRSVTADPNDVARDARYPCVLKPLALGASRGVIRADGPGEAVLAVRRLAGLLRSPEIRAMRDEGFEQILVEGFIPGQEVALEGLLRNGELTVLALFDKPDPLDGPYFEETLYVSPSRLPEPVQRGIFKAAARAARALGLVHGPIHAEFRVNDECPWILEMAPRPIGGLCSRTLRFAYGATLETVILRHALGWEPGPACPARGASGVMMIPIPARGIFQRVEGVQEAQAVDGIEDIVIAVKPRQILVPLPEGGSYLGFIFARGRDPHGVEEALRAAHAKLSFAITPGWVANG